MKSKVSFCNACIFRSDVTRFAPVWVLYTVGLLLLHVLQLSADGDYNNACRMWNLINDMVIISGVYALVVSQALFGDLLSPRLCVPVHALPLTRDDYFCSHAMAGFCFCIVPNLLVGLVCLPILGKGAPLVMYWLGVSVGTYVFFFGTALVCVQLAGNRIAAAMLYGLVHGFPVAAVWVVRYLYEPLLFGVDLPIRKTILKLCPAVTLYEKAYVYPISTEGPPPDYIRQLAAIKRVGGWGELAVWMVVGCACIAAAQMLYRKRKLEVAGDLLAFPKSIPVVLTLYTLTVGGLAHLVGTRVFGNANSYLLLLAGLVVGWYTGRMLLLRQVHVFRKRALIPLAGVLVAVGLSIACCVYDVGGVAHRIPTVEQLDHIEMTSWEVGNPIQLCTPEDLEAVRGMHQEALNRHDALSLREKLDRSGSSRLLYGVDYRSEAKVTYVCKNGRELVRNFPVYTDTPGDAFLRELYHRPEVIFQSDKVRTEGLLNAIRKIDFYDYTRRDVNGSYSGEELNAQQKQGLVEAMLKDIEAGQISASYRDINYHAILDLVGFSFEMQDVYGPEQTNLKKRYAYGFVKSSSSPRFASPYITLSCENTIEWMLDNGFLTQETLDEVQQRYDDEMAYRNAEGTNP